MIAYLEGAIFFIMQSPLIMGLWVALTTMLYLLKTRAHRFRRQGTLRLFITSAIIGIAIPLATMVLGRLIQTELHGTARRVVVILSAPAVIVLAFALTVTLIQRFLGADAETALALSWPITVITYVVPIAFCFILAIFQQKWLTGQESLY